MTRQHHVVERMLEQNSRYVRVISHLYISIFSTTEHSEGLPGGSVVKTLCFQHTSSTPIVVAVVQSLWPWPPCPSPPPGVCSNSRSLSQWCHPTISSSVVPFSSCLQSFPALGSFPVSKLFASGGQSIGASASVLPMNSQDWFPLGLTGWISLLSKRL